MNYFPQGLLPYNKAVNSRKYENSNQLHPWNAPDSYTQEWTNYPSDVLNYKADRTGWHPTQKPVDLLPTSSRLTPNPARLCWITAWGLAPPRLPQWTLTVISSVMKLVKNTRGVPLIASGTTTQLKPSFSDSFSRDPVAADRAQTAAILKGALVTKLKIKG